MTDSKQKLVWWDGELLLQARERRLLPVPLHAYRTDELVEELKQRSSRGQRIWSRSDRDVINTVFSYQLPLFLASIPTWYVEHPLFVVRKHMDRNSLRFVEAARRIFQEAGSYGFFAGYSTYGARVMYVERRIPNYNEVRERFWFSCGGLRLPVAFGLSHLSTQLFYTYESSLLTPLCCFGSGFLAALCSCPKETLMHQSIFSHADYVKNCIERRKFAEQPVYQRFFQRVKSLSFDPVGQKHYSPTSALAAKANVKGLFQL